jgi:hypothetical protein
MILMVSDPILLFHFIIVKRVRQMRVSSVCPLLLIVKTSFTLPITFIIQTYLILYH